MSNSALKMWYFYWYENTWLNMALISIEMYSWFSGIYGKWIVMLCSTCMKSADLWLLWAIHPSPTRKEMEGKHDELSNSERFLETRNHWLKSLFFPWWNITKVDVKRKLALWVWKRFLGRLKALANFVKNHKPGLFTFLEKKLFPSCLPSFISIGFHI